MKRKLLLLSVMVICIAIAAAGTLAFFNGDATAHNVITTGKVGIMPGTTVNKIVVVSGEDGTADAWVRVKFTKSIQLADGKQGEVDLDLIRLNIDTSKWELKDGWYYYKEAVKANQEAAPALLSVQFDATMDNTYQGATATVDVLAQAVQCANNGTSAQTAGGWPVDGTKTG